MLTVICFVMTGSNLFRLVHRTMIGFIPTFSARQGCYWTHHYRLHVVSPAILRNLMVLTPFTVSCPASVLATGLERSMEMWSPLRNCRTVSLRPLQIGLQVSVPAPLKNNRPSWKSWNDFDGGPSTMPAAQPCGYAGLYTPAKQAIAQLRLQLHDVSRRALHLHFTHI